MTKLRLVENLSHRQRELTPPRLARYLAGRVRDLTGSSELAALWVRRDTPYREIEGVDCWDAVRNALLYGGPHPVIAHPPCGPWGKYRMASYESRAHAIFAMACVHEFGGVVEQPLGSALFRDFGLRSGWIERISQADFGHLADKQTLLYFHPGREGLIFPR